MRKPILVTGGTGVLGAALVPRLLAAGLAVRLLSRQPHCDGPRIEYVRGDLQTGEGIDAAVAGVETVIHGAGSAKGDAAKAQNLVTALRHAGTARHILYVSVVGADTTPVVSRIDRATLGYFEAKRMGELAVMECGIPWTILRPTQFHTFFTAYAELGLKLPFVPSFAGFRYQPVDPRDVADRLAALAVAPPGGVVPEIGGPQIYPMAELLGSYLRATGHRRAIIPMRMPGGAAKAQRAGANLTPDHANGTRTWEEFLAELPGESVSNGAVERAEP
jgi:uncharacterized protein YbjT (DUF2867 family)